MDDMPGNSPKRSCSRVGEMGGIAHEFTKYLIQNGFIRMEHRKVKKEDLIGWFLKFQAIYPSYVSSQNVIFALSSTHVLRKQAAADPLDVVEFKELIFQQHLENIPITTDHLIRPKIRVFVNPSAVFRSNGQKAPPIDGLRCKICNYTCKDTADLEKHLESDLHVLRNQYRTEKDRFVREILGLAVFDVNVDLEKEERKTYKLKFTNVSPKVFRIVKTHTLVNLPEVLPRSYNPTDLKTGIGKTFEYTMDVFFPRYGAYEFPVVTEIESEQHNTTIKLLSVPTFRVLKAEVRDLAPVSPYQPREKNTIRFEDVPFISGVPYPYKVPLPLYPLPDAINRILNKGLRASTTIVMDEVVLKKMRQALCNSTGTEVLHNKVGLRPENYVERFTYLLFIEEHWMNQEIRTYNRDDVELLLNRKVNSLLGLQVPGLSEGRPSVLKGDAVFIRQGVNAKCKYQGIVHEVQENTAYLAFNGSFKYIAKQKVRVEFTLNRVTMRICHRALEIIQKKNLVSFLFPSNKMLNPLPLPTRLAFRNRNIETNREQMIAVTNIVRNTAYPAPYIIYGPPGTGKTATIVEAVAQLFFSAGISGPKICVCAPSNAAADLIAKRLLTFGVPNSAVLRIYGMSVDARAIPIELEKCSNFEGPLKDLPFPSETKIKSKSIVVVTPITAGRLYGVTGESYFDYLFFDEAGHAEETLTLVPITGLLKRNEHGIQGSLILAGDPKQLGPIIHSRLAVHLGLDMSLMERLMLQRPLYQRLPKGGYDNEVITKLLKNYRSHPVLLKLPNDLFYDSQLEAAAYRPRTDCLSTWDQLPTKYFPLVFHGVNGKDDREANSPSYFNRDEIMVIGEYLAELVDCRVKGYLVSQNDIIILTPYRKQVEKIRQYLKSKKWEKVSVASVEQFQGQEKLIVIISTVRSRSEFIQSDYMFGLGFLRNPKRFNVAMTRAIALSIIVGNPNILQCDPNWRALLKFCRDNNSYRGIPPSGEVPEDLDPNTVLDLNVSALIVTADEIPEDEKPSFRTDE